MKEHAQLWNYVKPHHDPINFDSYKGDFISINSTFTSLIDSPRILLDEIILPDECSAITEALKTEKAKLVSDGSSGGSAFIISAGKRIENKLTGFNWSPGTKEDKIHTEVN